MKENTSLYVTLVATSILLMSILLLVMVGPVEALETDNGSATIEYDYDNTEINYELNETLFESYRLQALSEPSNASFTSDGFINSETNAQWVQNGSVLYWSQQTTIYQLNVSEPYNASTVTSSSSSEVPSSSSVSIIDFTIGNDGQTVIYTVSTDSSIAHQTSLSNPYSITSINSTDKYTADILSFYNSFDITNNGRSMYASTGSVLAHNTMNTPWNISTFESAGASWDSISVANDITDLQMINDSENSAIVSWKDSSELAKLQITDTSYAIDHTKDVGTMDSFLLSENGRELFVNRNTENTNLELDTYTMNEYNATIINGTGETIATVAPLSQEGSIPYQTDTNESDVQLHWNAVTNSTYSGSSNTITINATGSTDPPDTQPSDGMNIIVWAILFVVAIGTTTYSLFASMDNAALLLSSVSLGLWIVLSYGALGLRLQADGPDEFTVVSEPAVAILCIGAAGICVINSLVILFDWARGTEGVSDP